MAGIDVGGHGGKRSVNQEIPLIPFIDFLLCLVSFLLITAVWTEMSRINADARVPGPPDPERELTDEPKDMTLHVEMAEAEFQLVWRQGSTVVSDLTVPRRREEKGDDEFAYSDLAKQVTDEWGKNGAHRSPTDPKRDQAVLHTDNTTPFQDIVAVIDAIYAAQRKVTVAGLEKDVPAFNVTFAVN